MWLCLLYVSWTGHYAQSVSFLLISSMCKFAICNFCISVLRQIARNINSHNTIECVEHWLTLKDTILNEMVFATDGISDFIRCIRQAQLTWLQRRCINDKQLQQIFYMYTMCIHLFVEIKMEISSVKNGLGNDNFISFCFQCCAVLVLCRFINNNRFWHSRFIWATMPFL